MISGLVDAFSYRSVDDRLGRAAVRDGDVEKAKGLRQGARMSDHCSPMGSTCEDT